MTPLYQALLFGAIGAICSWIVHRGLAAFHDGVRPLVREVAERRRPRAEAADSTWNMSLGFVLYYGAPFSLVTGVMEKHIVGLAADWIGVRSGRGTIAAAGGFAWGAAASGVISGAQWVFANLPEPIDRQLLLMGRPVYYMLPLIPVVAAASQFGIGVALRIAGLTAVTFVVAHSVDADVAVGVSFAVAAVTMLLLALRERAEVDPQIDEFAAGAVEAREGILALAVNGAFIGLGASLLWLAGEPAAVMLIGLDHPVEAALVGIFSWFGFIPLVTLTSLTSRAYVTAGMPDGVTAVNFLMPPVAAPVVGAAVLAGEARMVGRLERLLAHRPGLHAAATAIRDGMLLVSEVALLIGGALSADAIWPGVGLFLVGGLWLLNEAAGVPVMRVAVGPLAAVLVGLVFNVHHVLT